MPKQRSKPPVEDPGLPRQFLTDVAHASGVPRAAGALVIGLKEPPFPVCRLREALQSRYGLTGLALDEGARMVRNQIAGDLAPIRDGSGWVNAWADVPRNNYRFT